MVHYIYLGILLGCWNYTFYRIWWYCSSLLLTGFNCGPFQIIDIWCVRFNRPCQNVSYNCTSIFACQKNWDFSWKFQKRWNFIKTLSKNREILEKKRKGWHNNFLQGKNSFHSIVTYDFTEKVSAGIQLSKVKNLTIFSFVKFENFTVNFTKNLW